MSRPFAAPFGGPVESPARWRLPLALASGGPVTTGTFLPSTEGSS
jgi:hypothetical protein